MSKKRINRENLNGLNSCCNVNADYIGNTIKLYKKIISHTPHYDIKCVQHDLIGYRKLEIFLFIFFYIL